MRVCCVALSMCVPGGTDSIRGGFVNTVMCVLAPSPGFLRMQANFVARFALVSTLFLHSDDSRSDLRH